MPPSRISTSPPDPTSQPSGGGVPAEVPVVAAQPPALPLSSNSVEADILARAMAGKHHAFAPL